MISTVIVFVAYPETLHAEEWVMAFANNVNNYYYRQIMATTS
jgi:hypothetical protein